MINSIAKLRERKEMIISVGAQKEDTEILKRESKQINIYSFTQLSVT